MAVKIDKKIPLPRVKKRPSFVKYPFDSMKVGDSFYIAAIDSDEMTIKKIRRTLIASAYYYNKTNSQKWKFATRKIGSGIRIWRTK